MADTHLGFAMPFYGGIFGNPPVAGEQLLAAGGFFAFRNELHS